MSSSRIPGFYRASLAARRGKLVDLRDLSPADAQVLDTGGIDPEVADGMIENVIGLYALPLGLGLNFRINDKDYVVPMAVEEPSVIAAASNAAKMVRSGGGFTAEVSRALMIAQIQIVDVADIATAVAAIEREREQILARGRDILHRLVARGGGPTEVRVRVLPEHRDEHPATRAADESEAPMLVVHILVDCVDAMGANMVNTLAEGLADELAALAGGRPGLRILSNLADERTVTVTARIPDHALAAGGDGAAVRRAIVAASRFAERDPYRAATHNKGIMNGVDAVLLATGNDWRGVEAGAHAFACRDGRYRPLATWREVPGPADATSAAGVSSGPASESPGGPLLEGRLHMPMAVATVGGALHVHAGARLSLSLLGTSRARELAGVVGAVGLASNLAALRALATDGIQRGHMSLHARMVARSVGATGAFIERVAAEISELGDVNADRARQVLQRLRTCADSDSQCEDSP